MSTRHIGPRKYEFQEKINVKWQSIPLFVTWYNHICSFNAFKIMGNACKTLQQLSWYRQWANIAKYIFPRPWTNLAKWSRVYILILLPFLNHLRFINYEVQGFLKICQLPSAYNYDNYWPVQKVKLFSCTHTIHWHYLKGFILYTEVLYTEVLFIALL
jgi:hypothetical protein